MDSLLFLPLPTLAQVRPAVPPQYEWLFLIGEILSGTAYLVVAGILFYLAIKRDDRQRKMVLMLFGVLGALGAGVHFLNLGGSGDWFLTVQIIRFVIGVFSILTAVALYKAIPNLLAIPSPEHLEKSNQELRDQIQERERAEVALRETQQELELRVQQRTAQLITANRDMEREMESRKSAEKQLIAKNYELVRTNADLDDFVYYASRDIKGPVLNVAGLVAAIKEELPPNNEVLANLFSRLDNSVEQINRKLNNLSEVSRIQRPAEQVQQSTVSFQEVFNEVLETLDERLKGVQHTIETDFSSAPEVYISRENLHSLLFHLLTNSIKYRDPSRPLHIVVSSDLQDRFIRLMVKDNGLGMETTQYEGKIFSLFRRFHDHVEGSGIGLYIIKRIMDNHRGKVEVKSTVGEGTTFYLSFLNIVPTSSPSETTAARV
jgi:signal transduction histidine kinase